MKITQQGKNYAIEFQGRVIYRYYGQMEASKLEPILALVSNLNSRELGILRTICHHLMDA